MVSKLDLTFWITVVLIVVVGTIGSVLFKSGTNILGTIDYARLLEIKMSSTTLAYGGVLLLSVVMFFFSGYMLGDFSFAAKYLFTPIIFIGLIMLAMSRFLIGIPLSVTGLGRLTGLLTAIQVVVTALASYLVFKETFTTRMLAGMALAVFAVVLLGE
jgi:drug/metabolite transporter (DMT)-like permease